ncbi:MAG: 30S ribosomal protein S8 [Candidatus Lokiarchaeota archaeon]|nr:30S ribosomal protein S8 [Candidatus Lokiarchaeota archaeon]
MMPNTLGDACIQIKNAEMARKKSLIITPAPHLLQKILRIFQAHAYIGEFERYEDGRQNKFKVNLLGKINECKAIIPRLNIKVSQYEDFEKRFLPAKNFGLIIISTNEGVLTHNEAKSKNLGGILLAYIY